MSTTDKDKVNHYVGNLAMVWLDSINNKVQKVKDTQEFKQFCIDLYDKALREHKPELMRTEAFIKEFNINQ